MVVLRRESNLLYVVAMTMTMWRCFWGGREQAAAGYYKRLQAPDMSDGYEQWWFCGAAIAVTHTYSFTIRWTRRHMYIRYNLYVCMHSMYAFTCSLNTRKSCDGCVCVRVVLIFLATLQSSFTSSSVIKDAKLAKRREHHSHQSWNAPRTKETRQPCRRARDHGYTGLFVNVPYIDACFVVLLVPSIHT